MRKRLGECLVQSGLVTEEDLRSALVEQRRTREHLGVVLTRRGLATDLQIATTVAGQLGLPFETLVDRAADPAVSSLIPVDVAVERGCVALTLHRHVLTLAMADPLLLGFVQDLESRTGYRVRTVVAAASDIAAFIRRAYSAPEARLPPPNVPAGEFEDDAPDTDVLLDSIVAQALRPGIAEVRIQPLERSAIVSARVDGCLEPTMTLAGDTRDALLSRLKRRACMNPDDCALAQDGRLRVSGAYGSLRTVRVFTRPAPFGELAVLRAGPDEEAPTLPLDALGLWGVSLESLSRVLAEASGLLLISAPAVGGASTTARSAFDAIGPSRSRALVGDILDADHAGLALTAAREGALVIATLQASDAAAAVDRLVGLSWSPDLVADVLAGVVAQSLVHRLCGQCRRPAPGGEGSVAVGCAQCGYSGYRGRIALFEVMRVESQWSSHIAQGGASLREAAVAGGMVTLAEDAMAKVRAGIVSFAEVRAVPGLDSARPTCPACGAVTGEADEACGRCGSRLRETCRSCGRALRPEWGTCPYCATSVQSGTLLERLS